MFEWHFELHLEKKIQQSFNRQLSPDNMGCIPTSLQTPQGAPVNQYSKKKRKRKVRTNPLPTHL